MLIGLAAALVVAGAFAVGCSGGPRRAGGSSDGAAGAARSASARTAEPVVFLIPGEPLFLPIVAAVAEPGKALPQNWTPVRRPDLSFGTGEPIPAETVRIEGANPDPFTTSGWLPATAAWTSRDFSSTARGQGEPEDRASRPGFWAVVATLPEAAEGAPILLDGRPIQGVWLPPGSIPENVRAPAVTASAEARQALLGVAGSDAADPLRRWRVNLLRDRLGGARVAGDGAGVLLPPPLEALARQNEARWRAALAALMRAGPDTAAAVASRLTAVVLTPRGTLLPAWPFDDPELHRLRSLLLDPRTSDDDRLNAAQAWLSSQPPALAWVIDDGLGAVGSDGQRTVRVAFANLTHLAVQAAISPEEIAPRTSTAVPPFQIVPLATELSASNEPLAWVRVRTESWETRLPVCASPFIARPPGFPLGPFVPEWTLPSWLRGATPVSPPTRTAAGLLRRSVEGDGWQVYVECRVASDADSAMSDVVRVRWGPGEGDTAEVRRPDVSDAPTDRWSALVPLNVPADAESVRLSVERIDPRGVRSTWPGPVIPGEPAPLVTIRLDGWSGVSASGSR